MDAGTFVAKFHFQLATQLANAFAHAGNTDAESWCTGKRRTLGPSLYTFSVIDNFEVHFAGRLKNAYFGPGAAGVSVHVGQAFLQHTKQSSLGIGGEPDQLFVYGDVQMNATALLKTFGVPEHRGSKSAFIK